MTRVRLLPLLTAPLLLWSAPPAHACSCATGSVEEYIAWSDAVFVATVGEAAEPGRHGQSAVRAAVETVYDGDVPDEVTIVGAGPDSPCGLIGFRPGQTWLFYGSAEPGGDGSFAVSLCGGNHRTGPAGDPAVEAVLGRGRAVVATPDPVPGPDRPSDAGAPADDDRSGLLLGGAGAAVVVLAALAVVVRRRPAG